MRRDHFTVAIRESATGQPTLGLTYSGPTEQLHRHLTDDGEQYASDSLDASFRLRDAIDDPDATGVFSLTHRLTGEYILEINLDATALLELIQAAHDRDDEEDSNGTSYLVRIEPEEAGTDGAYDFRMDALFVYDAEGELLRQQSLIPSGVQL